MRLVADANVFVSAALGRSPQAPSVRIINAALDGRVELVMSPALLAEIADVLARPRIRKRISAEDAQLFLGDLVAQAVMFADPANPPSVCCDPDDDCLVALTLTASADVLVSDGPDLVFGRTATEVFYASTIRARANKAWKQGGPRADHPTRGTPLRDLLLHRGRSRLEADLDLGRPRRCPPDLEPLRAPRPRRRGASPAAARCVPDTHEPTRLWRTTVAHDHKNDETPENTGVLKYRYRDSNPGFRRERAAS